MSDDTNSNTHPQTNSHEYFTKIFNIILPATATTFQFGLWYMFIHTLYWSIEQLRYRWCVSHGLSGYFYSLLVNQSLVCTVLTETSKALSDTQISNFTMLISFIGIKCYSYIPTHATHTPRTHISSVK